MLRRAIISVLFPLVGVLTASAALLNPEQRNQAFQPGGATKVPQTVVIKPAQAAAPLRLWTGGKVQRITPSTPASVRADLGGAPLAKAGDGAVTPLVRKAGGSR
jgi:hypothetical protein